MSAGYVYVLSNPSMPGMIKVGFSKHGGESRAKSFYSGGTGVPTPYDLEFEVYSEDAPELERLTHAALAEHRVNPCREFFDCLVGHAITEILSIEQFRAGNKCAELWPDSISISSRWAEFQSDQMGAIVRDGYLPITQEQYAKAIDAHINTMSVRESGLLVRNPSRKLPSREKSKALLDGLQALLVEAEE